MASFRLTKLSIILITLLALTSLNSFAEKPKPTVSHTYGHSDCVFNPPPKRHWCGTVTLTEKIQEKDRKTDAMASISYIPRTSMWKTKLGDLTASKEAPELPSLDKIYDMRISEKDIKKLYPGQKLTGMITVQILTNIKSVDFTKKSSYEFRSCDCTSDKIKNYDDRHFGDHACEPEKWGAHPNE